MTIINSHTVSSTPYVFELNTYNKQDAKSNCVKMLQALEQEKVSLVKIANQVDSVNQNIDAKGYDVSWADFKNSLNNFINELLISSQTKLDGVFSKDVLDTRVHRADTGHVWLHQVTDSRYGMNSYQVVSSQLIDTKTAPNGDRYTIAAIAGTPGAATFTLDDGAGTPAAVNHGLANGTIVKITGTGSAMYDNKKFKVRDAATNVFTIDTGSSAAVVTATATNDIKVEVYGSKLAPTKVAAASAGSKKVAVKSSDVNSFIGFYLPGINLYIDDNQTVDIQFLEKTSKLDVDTKDNPAALTITEYRVSPRYEEKVTHTIATTEVITADDEIDLGTVTHGFVTGQRVQYLNGGGTSIAGLTSGSVYYVIRVDDNEFKLATTAANASSGTAIGLTGTGNANQTISSVATPKNETELETYLGKFLNSNVDANDTTYNDADSKVSSDERDSLSQKLDQTNLIIKDFFLSPYLNM